MKVTRRDVAAALLGAIPAAMLGHVMHKEEITDDVRAVIFKLNPDLDKESLAGLESEIRCAMRKAGFGSVRLIFLVGVDFEAV